MRERIKDILLESIQVKEEILRNQINQIAQITQLMRKVTHGGRSVFMIAFIWTERN